MYTIEVTHIWRFLQYVIDQLCHDVIFVVQDPRNLIRDPFLDHRHVDLFHVHFLVELGREFRLAQQLLVDIGEKGSRHGGGSVRARRHTSLDVEMESGSESARVGDCLSNSRMMNVNAAPRTCLAGRHVTATS
jgi:hypothetical protein